MFAVAPFLSFGGSARARQLTSGAKIINVFRAWIGAQLTICAHK